jgi:hypothetical protein
MKNIQPKWMNVDDAQAYSGISKWTWRRMAYDGRIASTKVGKRLLLEVSSIDRVLADGYRPALTEEQRGGRA